MRAMLMALALALGGCGSWAVEVSDPGEGQIHCVYMNEDRARTGDWTVSD